MSALLKKIFKKEKPRKIEKKPEKKAEEQEKKPGLKETEKPQRPVNKAGAQVYRILKEPHITEKATTLAEQGKYVFKVYSQANKNEVKKAVESFYGVKVEKVNMVHTPSKKRRLGRTEGWRHGLKKGYKKAIVTLAKGERIELLPK
jgi:large subunit ribosomal protein L23